MEIKNRSCKRSHTEARRNLSRKYRNVSISSDSVWDSVANDPVKTRLPESEIEAEEPTKHEARNRTFWLVYPSASASTPTTLFSVNRKRWNHKRSGCSALYHITTQTMATSLVTTAFKKASLLWLVTTSQWQAVRRSVNKGAKSQLKTPRKNWRRRVAQSSSLINSRNDHDTWLVE